MIAFRRRLGAVSWLCLAILLAGSAASRAGDPIGSGAHLHGCEVNPPSAALTVSGRTGGPIIAARAGLRVAGPSRAAHSGGDLPSAAGTAAPPSFERRHSHGTVVARFLISPAALALRGPPLST